MGSSPSPSAIATASFLGVFLILLATGLFSLHSSINSQDTLAAEELTASNPQQDTPDDWSPYRPDEGWEVLEPVAVLEDPDLDVPDLADLSAHDEVFHEPHTQQAPAPGTTNRAGSGTIVVITNFNRADVQVNGEAYPFYSEDGQNRGIRLPARTEHEIRVNFDGRQKLYRVTLAPGERRLLMVELTGMRASDEPLPTPRRAEPVHEGNPDEADAEQRPDRGQVTVYSRPQGTIYIGDRATGENTPGSVEVEEGRHEVFVRYEDGEKSEPKVVRVRQGSRIKLFFRQDDE